MHFGKVFVLSGDDFEKMWGEDLIELRKLIVKHDPKGKFMNAWLDKYVFNGGRASYG